MQSTHDIVGRFQVPFLHESHKALIDYVLSQHKDVVIILGTNNSVNLSTRNPLDFVSRLKMIRESYPNILVLGIEDCYSNDDWSKNLDLIIKTYHNPQWTRVLYGGRDSFIKHYTGIFPTIELDYHKYISGTQLRQQASLLRESSQDWRSGVIHGVTNRFDISYQVVDMVVTRGDEVLCIDKGRGWQFPGGFVDVSDQSLESAARRELKEECGSFEVSLPTYIGSFRVDDYRYRGERDKIMSSVYLFDYLWGNVKLGDDAKDCKYDWIHIKDIKVAKSHEPIKEMVNEYLFND